MNHLVSDFIIRIKNSTLANRREVVLPYSKINKEVGKLLVKEGFLEDIKEEVKEGKKSLKATIKYENRVPALSGVEVISKPSLRVYGGVKEIGELRKRGKKTVVVSTSQGLMTSIEANKKGVGGEVLFAIW